MLATLTIHATRGPNGALVPPLCGGISGPGALRRVPGYRPGLRTRRAQDAARSAAPSRATGDRWHERTSCAASDTRFHWDGHRLIGEEDKDGVLQRTYVQQPGLRYGATLAEAPGSDPASAAYRYFGRDAHGSTRAAYAQDKARVGAAEWLPYGQARLALGAAGAHGFTGQWQSARSGDYLFGLRPYSPGLSRWLARDPLGPVDGPNMHTYVRANPIAYVDPEGGVSVLVVVGGVVGGAVGAYDQWARGCGEGSIAVGAAIGAAGGALTAYFALKGIAGGLLGGGAVGLAQAYVTGSSLMGGVIGGALGGGVGGKLDKLGDSLAGGIGVGAWISVGIGFGDELNNNYIGNCIL